MESTIPQTFAEITPEMIHSWKAKYGAVKHLVIKKTQDGNAEISAQFAAIQPSRTVIDLLGKFQTERNPIEANKTIVANCILGGDMEMLNSNGYLYTEVLAALKEMGDDFETEIKNF